MYRSLFCGFKVLIISIQVVLAANDLPSINDVTYPELIEIMSKVIERKLSELYKFLKILVDSDIVSGNLPAEG